MLTLLETLWKEFTGFFGLQRFIDLLQAGEFEKLLTYDGIVALIIPIIPLLILLEFCLSKPALGDTPRKVCTGC